MCCGTQFSEKQQPLILISQSVGSILFNNSHGTDVTRYGSAHSLCSTSF